MKIILTILSVIFVLASTNIAIAENCDPYLQQCGPYHSAETKQATDTYDRPTSTDNSTISSGQELEENKDNVAAAGKPASQE